MLTIRKTICATLPALVLGLAISTSTNASENAAVVVKEWFFTPTDPRDNTDSPAVWHGPDGQHWLLATTKETHSILICDAINGALISRFGGLGEMHGQFNRPNGIWVIDDLLLVVERDNRRVQVFHLPDLTPLTSFGSAELAKPYGLYVQPMEPGVYHVYVTDNYETATEEKPPLSELGRRVVLFELEVEGSKPGTAAGELVQTFGDTSGKGVLNIVESIFGDPGHDRLLIADEEMSEAGQDIKVYTLDGKFTGTTIGEGIFAGQPEGIALLANEDGSGFWIATDQGKELNQFHVFDRETLEHLGTFKGEVTLNTDGIWLAPEPVDRFPQGVFYAIQNDRAVAAFSWAEIAESLGFE